MRDVKAVHDLLVKVKPRMFKVLKFGHNRETKRGVQTF